MAVQVRPQIFLRGDQMNISCADREGLTKLIEYIDEQIKSGRLGAAHQKISPEISAPRFMMHRSNDALVEAASEEEANHLLSVIEKNWATIKEQSGRTEAIEEIRHQTPSVAIKMTMLPNDEFRAIAKIAFETTALLLGPEVVLRESFDPLRDYIMGDVRLPSIDENNPEELAIDSRFVGRAPDGGLFPFTENHGVILFHNPELGLAAMVVLYGTHHYKVRLAPPQERRRWMRHYEFAYTKDGHRELNDLEFAQRALERFPHLLNIDRAKATEMLEVLNGKQKDSWMYEDRQIAERS